MPTQDSPHILSERTVRESERPVVVSIPNLHSTNGWQVNLEREGEVVRAIHITCSCGEQLSIECEYDSSGK